MIQEYKLAIEYQDLPGLHPVYIQVFSHDGEIVGEAGAKTLHAALSDIVDILVDSGL